MSIMSKTPQAIALFPIPPGGLNQNLYFHYGATITGPMATSHPNWYHGHLTKETCFGALIQHPIGTFLLRPSSDPRAEYTLSVRSASGVMNMRVFRREEDGCLYLDAPEPYKYYAGTVEELVGFYKSSKKGIAPLDDMGSIGGSRFHLTSPLPVNAEQVENAINTLRQQKALNII